MPWKDKTVEEIRKEFVEAAMSEKRSFSEICLEFGITRKTGYKWLERYQNGESLSDQSRRPLSTTNKTPEETELLIVHLRQEHPGWGAKKLKQVLENQGYTMPCFKTVNNILNRYHCITLDESLKHRAFQRFEMRECNEMWQTDFKGEFKMQNGEYCYPLDIIDDHSRYVIRIVPSTTTANIVLPTFREAFYEYGMPNSVLSDNGTQFAGFRQGYTQFEKWLMDHDVQPIHGRIKHPQTQGKIERFHRSMKEELLKHKTPSDIDEARSMLREWQELYNTVRPHEALHMQCPADVYTPSKRQYVDRVEPYEYSGAFHVIKVNSWGYVRFDRWQVYLSETMVDQYIEFCPNPLGDSFIACYRNFKIAEFDTRTGRLINRTISRL